MSSKFMERLESVTKKVKSEVDTAVNKITIDTNIFSNFGTIWTQSTSAAAGLTESVITPGIRAIKFVAGIMRVYKKLQYNFNTIQTKLTSITNKLNSFSTGNYEHIRKSVIKMKVNNN